MKVEIPTPNDFCEMIKKYFSKDRKFIFILTIILGIITHFLLLSNLILSQAGLLNGIHYTAGDYEATLGRWGINIFDSIRHDIALPFLTTMISIILMGFINILLIDLFEIKNRIFKIFVILSVVVSPSLCITLLYAYTADAYMFAMLFAIFSAYSLYQIKSQKLGILLSIISFILVLGTYQSYIGITIGLILMISAKKLLSQEEKAFEVIKEIIRNAVILIISAILYFIITKILLAINELTLSSYDGLNEISLTTIFLTLIPSIKHAYIGFLKFFFADGIILNRIWKREKLYLLLYILFAITFVIELIRIVKAKKKDEFLNYMISTAIILFIPIALNFVVILAPGNEIYYLTSTQMLLMIPFMLKIFEIINKNTNIENVINWIFVIVNTIIMITYFLSIIVTYQTLDFSYNQAKTIANRVVEKMEETEGYHNGMQVLFAGVVDDINSPKTLDIYNYAINNSLRASIFHGTYYGQEATWRNFMDMFTGVHLNFCEDYQYYNIITSEEFEKMEIFPGKNSIKIIDNIIVVKFTENPELPPYSENMQIHGIQVY